MIPIRKIIRNQLNQTNECKAKQDFYGVKGYALVRIGEFSRELAVAIIKELEKNKEVG